jgi:hypothetical protein
MANSVIPFIIPQVRTPVFMPDEILRLPDVARLLKA